jgi:hypothetical protein
VQHHKGVELAMLNNRLWHRSDTKYPTRCRSRVRHLQHFMTASCVRIEFNVVLARHDCQDLLNRVWRQDTVFLHTVLGLVGLLLFAQIFCIEARTERLNIRSMRTRPMWAHKTDFEKWHTSSPRKSHIAQHSAWRPFL